MTAFFFDEGHPDLEMIFGPQCASYIINAIIDLNGPSHRLLRGSLLHSRYCYGLTEVTLSEKKSTSSGLGSSSSSQHYKPDMDHYLTIICDLAETMVSSGSSMSEADLQETLARKNIWVVVAQNLSDEARSTVAKSLEGFAPFLGWVKVDWRNPVHADLFAKSLFQDMFVDKDGLCKFSEWPEGSEDREEEEALLREYKSKLPPRLLEHTDFERLAPRLLALEEPNERGLLSTQRAIGSELSHRQKIGEALSKEAFEADGDFRKFSTSRPEEGIEFEVPEAKLTKYLLNLEHKDGGPKARFFRDTLGIVLDDWRYLADQLCQAARNSEFYRLKVTQFGVMHGAQILISGRNGRQAVIETGWKLEEAGPGLLVTAYPGDEKLISSLEPFFGRVPKPDCPFPDRWEQIHEMAHHCGKQRGEEKAPTPMVLEKWGTIWEGACGFGWVFLSDARLPFAKWALKSGIGYASRPGVHISSPLVTQSVEKNLAYAEGYAEVLKANGIRCRAKSRLD